MPKGEIKYDKIADIFTCEYPVKEKNGKITVCGKDCRDLARHITKQHKISAREYKRMMGVDLKEPLLSKRTRDSIRKAILKDKDRLANLATGKNTRFKKGKVTVQNYPRSEQTKQRLRGLRTN